MPGPYRQVVVAKMAPWLQGVSQTVETSGGLEEASLGTTGDFALACVNDSLSEYADFQRSLISRIQLQ